MSKNNKTTRQVLSSFKGRMESSSPVDRSQLESAAAQFFDQVAYYCASLGIAWPTGLELKFPDGSGVRFSRTARKAAPLTERQKESLRELLMPLLLRFYKSIACNCTEADRDKIEKKEEQYKKGLSATLQGKNSPKKWLIEHEEEIKNLTPREMKERFGLKTSLKKLHEKHVEHKDEPRGQASPNYRFKKG
jgi:hypothetical protein